MHPPWHLCGLQGITQGISAWPAVAESVYFKVMLMLTEKHIVLHCDRVGGFTRGLLVNSPLLRVDVLSVLSVETLAVLSWT